MKKIFIGILICILLFTGIRTAKAETTQITLFFGKVSAIVNSKEINLDVPVIIDKTCNRTLVPLRFISEAFGAKVKWNAISKEVNIVLGNKDIKLFIGEKIAYINGSKLKMDCAPKILFSRTIVPIRFVSEVFGATVNWFSKERKIEILFKKNDETCYNSTLKADSSAISLTKKTVKIKSQGLDKITFYIAKINLNGKNIHIVPFLSKNGPKTRETYQSFISRVKPIVAINSGTFDLKTNILTGDVVKNGIPQYIRYDGYEYTETIGVTENNIPFFENGKILYEVHIDNTDFPLRSVNGFPAHPYNAKIKLFTNWYKSKITAKENEEIFIVKSSKVIKTVKELYTSTLADREWALVIDSSSINKKPKVVRIQITINGKDYSGSSFIRCGPLLIKNGLAYIDYKKYSNLNRTLKKGARTLIGIGKNSEFYFIYTPDPVSLNYGTLSIALAKCKMFEYVISLDGGGSTLFYYKGKYIAKPGREIIDIIAIPTEIQP
jgi:exopolysaccharide biosynthesis protein